MADDRKVLVHFINEDLTDIIDISSIPVEARFVGCVSGQVKWNKQQNVLTKVLMISDNMESLERKEDEFHEVLDAKKKGAVASKRNRKPSQKKVDAASDRDVSLALNERPKLTRNQQKEKTTVAKRKKKETASTSAAQGQLDKDILSIFSSSYQPADSDNQTSAQEDEPDTIRDDPRKQTNEHTQVLNMRGGAVQGADPTEGLGAAREDPSCEVKRVLFSGVQDDGDIHEKDCKDGGNILEDKVGCASCQKLRNMVNNGSRAFVSQLAEFMDLEESRSIDKGSHEIKYLDTLPVKPSEQKVEVSKGSNVFISLRQKNQIKADYRNAPQRMAYNMLIMLFGKDVFRKSYITARGNAPGSKGIREHVLKAVHSFVNRNVDENKRISWAIFIKAINRRAGAWREERPTSAVNITKLTCEDISEASISSPVLTPVKASSPSTPASAGIDVKNRLRNKYLPGALSSAGLTWTPRKWGLAPTPTKISPVKHASPAVSQRATFAARRPTPTPPPTPAATTPAPSTPAATTPAPTTPAATTPAATTPAATTPAPSTPAATTPAPTSSQVPQTPSSNQSGNYYPSHYPSQYQSQYPSQYPPHPNPPYGPPHYSVNPPPYADDSNFAYHHHQYTYPRPSPYQQYHYYPHPSASFPPNDAQLHGTSSSGLVPDYTTL